MKIASTWVYRFNAWRANSSTPCKHVPSWQELLNVAIFWASGVFGYRGQQTRTWFGRPGGAKRSGGGCDAAGTADCGLLRFSGVPESGE